MLIFTPEVREDGEGFACLEALAEEVDIVQVRAKGLPGVASDPNSAASPAEARATYECARRALDVLAACESAPLLLVDDRVDVALALADEGCAGVHLGQHDFPPREARALLGEAALIGLSTHDVQQVVLASEEPVDYLGFGPIFPTTTKGYQRGLGPDAVWVANTGASLPLFPIGGIALSNIGGLHEVGRAAVGSALLTAEDPVARARQLRELLLT